MIAHTEEAHPYPGGPEHSSEMSAMLINLEELEKFLDRPPVHMPPMKVLKFAADNMESFNRRINGPNSLITLTHEREELNSRAAKIDRKIVTQLGSLG